jgi:hypothetical protein
VIQRSKYHARRGAHWLLDEMPKRLVLQDYYRNKVRGQPVTRNKRTLTISSSNRNMNVASFRSFDRAITLEFEHTTTPSLPTSGRSCFLTRQLVQALHYHHHCRDQGCSHGRHHPCCRHRNPIDDSKEGNQIDRHPSHHH